MPNCAIATCKNNNRNTKGRDIVYHEFPKDLKLCDLWLKTCKRKDKINTTYARVCSIHFRNEDYIRDLKAELLNLKPKKRLNATAVPSLHLKAASTKNTNSESTQFDVQVSNRKNSYNKRETRKRALNTLKTLSPLRIKPDATILKTDKLEERIENFKKRNKFLKIQVEKLKLKNKLLTSALVIKTKSERNLFKKFNKKVKENVIKILENIFTKLRNDALFQSKEQTHRTDDSISEVLTLQTISEQCYVFLRNNIGIPLPGLST